MAEVMQHVSVTAASGSVVARVNVKSQDAKIWRRLSALLSDHDIMLEVLQQAAAALNVQQVDSSCKRAMCKVSAPHGNRDSALTAVTIRVHDQLGREVDHFGQLCKVMKSAVGHVVSGKVFIIFLALQRPQLELSTPLDLSTAAQYLSVDADCLHRLTRSRKEWNEGLSLKFNGYAAFASSREDMARVVEICISLLGNNVREVLW